MEYFHLNLWNWEVWISCHVVFFISFRVVISHLMSLHAFCSWYMLILFFYLFSGVLVFLHSLYLHVFLCNFLSLSVLMWHFVSLHVFLCHSVSFPGDPVTLCLIHSCGIFQFLSFCVTSSLWCLRMLFYLCAFLCFVTFRILLSCCVFFCILSIFCRFNLGFPGVQWCNCVWFCAS